MEQIDYSKVLKQYLQDNNIKNEHLEVICNKIFVEALKNKTSLFNLHCFYENLKTNINTKEKTISIEVDFNIRAIGNPEIEDQNLVHVNFTQNYHIEKKPAIEYAGEYFARLLCAVVSGYKMSIFEISAIIELSKKFFSADEITSPVYICPVCSTEFDTPEKFVRHLNETGHIDSAKDLYGYWEPNT